MDAVAVRCHHDAGSTVQGTGVGMETVRAYVREVLDRAAKPLAWLLLWCHVTPNQVSLMGIVLTLVTAALIVDGQLLLAGAMYILAASLDLLDGVLARMAKMASRFGAFLDSTADRISEGVVFAAIAYHFASHGQSVDAALAVLALLGSLLVSYTRARAEGLGLECKVGIMTRAERVLLIAFGLMLGLLPAAIYLLVALTAFSAMQRILHTFRQLYPQG
jgi:CDP-diacylglycerol---glycerol-3-phosphate 3-phosphatidyltransferase